ncbi:LAGLIDADG family homing endonuclease [Candidatus Micrarchaeota archaeon]|nr:LAGLIDADG family homing endonuclease [Candidatus Micrarchaeota archaeon]
MKIKLTPELSYFIGLWRKCRTFEGLGVKGKKELLEVFSKIAIDLQLTTPEKFIAEEDRVYFYHTAYRKFFQDIEKEQLERFKYLNEYSAGYLAGIFDGAGSIDEKGIVSISKMNREDELMLLRLGFNTKRRSGALVIERPLIFLTFIRNSSKLFREHEIFKYVEKSKIKNKKKQ